MSADPQQLEGAITALESQRALLGDAVVDAALGPMRAALAALTAAPPPKAEQQLKQVSILFLDVVGSTTLSQHLDPEATSAVMDDALRRGSAVVQARQGKVLQYAGDNILAAFGAEDAREDDAERAVRCGLALLDLGRALGAEVQTAHAHAGFDVRVGIHTGGVLLGGGVNADGTIRGIAVNIAARMEQTAPAGALRISHDTYAQVRGLFDVEVQAPMPVKGLDMPVLSYLVTRAKPRNFRIGTRGIEGVATKMVGRDAELEVLQQAFGRLFEDRQLAAVTVVADAGIGKSRLLYEFEAWSEARPESFFLFRGRATPQTQGQPFGLLRDILAWRLQIADDDTIEAARAKMEQGIIPLFIADDGPDFAEGHAHLLGHLIGIEWRDSRHIKGIVDDPGQIRNRAFHAAAQLFRRVSASDGSPVILELEDLHWADNESLDFLNYLSEVNRDVPLLILGFSRATLFERRGDWKSTEGIHVRIDLAPLDATGSRLLANELLKKLPDVPAALRELITGGSEGNPFYMEELVKMLIDQGAILTRSDSGETWKLNAERLLVTHVPPTLTGVLQARLDSLPAQEKLTLQEASVIGPVFWDQALCALDARAHEALPALVNRELALARDDAHLDGLREFAFRHQLLHRVTYDTVLKRSKRELHAKVADWLSRQTGLRAGDFLSATAEHHERAGNTARAAEFHTRAAEHARERFGHDAVLTHVAKALALLADESEAKPELRWRLLDVREQTLELQAQRDEQGQTIEAMEQLAEALADDRKRAYVARRRANRALRMRDWPTLERAARRSMAYAERAGEHGLRLHALRLLASARINVGDIEGGQTLAREGLAEARRLGLRENEAVLLNTLASAAGLQDDLMGSLYLAREGLQICSQAGDRRGEAVAMSNLGQFWLLLGDLAQARRDLDEAVRMLRANGDRFIEGSALMHLSSLALWQGDGPRALKLARSALDITVAAQARQGEEGALRRLGEAELALGRLEPARRAFEQSRVRATELGAPVPFDACAGLARVALMKGDIPGAMQALQGVLDHVEGSGSLDYAESAPHVALSCFQVLDRAGDPRAAGWLARSHEALQAQAATIPEGGLRQGYLQNIPHHREIAAAWSARQQSVPDGAGRQ